jgi:hypothetical protein
MRHAYLRVAGRTNQGRVGFVGPPAALHMAASSSAEAVGDSLMVNRQFGDSLMVNRQFGDSLMVDLG